MSSLYHHSAQTPLSPRNVQNFSAQQEDFSIESTFLDITTSLQSLDFDAFFKKFALTSPVCQYMEAFNPADLHSLITKASALTDGLPLDSPPVKAVRKAKKALDDELAGLNTLFKEIEAAGLRVGNVRISLRWLREVNRRSLERLNNSNTGVSEDRGIPLELRYPMAMPSVPIPLLSWQQQYQRYRDAQVALMAHSKSPRDGRSIPDHLPPPPQRIPSHHTSPSQSAPSIPLRSPTRNSFPSRRH